MDVLFQRGVWLLVVLAAWMAASASGGPGEKPPVVQSNEEHIADLIEQLGDTDYYTRQKAQDELARLGFEAFDALSAATTHEDLEIAARARYLLRLMQVEWTREGDPPQVRTLLDDYGWQQPEDRRDRIEKLARLPDGAGTAALCRIVRFEQSGEMSKLAAIELLSAYVAGKSPLPEVMETIDQSLRGSRRPGSRWLLAWAGNYRSPEALVADFAEFIEEEQALLARPGLAVHTDVLAALLRFQVAWLEELNRREQAIAAMRRLIALEKGDVEDLRKLLVWLIAQKAWPLVDELADRFEGQVWSTPALLYLLAEAQAGQGSAEEAEKTASQALALRQGNNRNWLNERRILAMELWQRNRPDWAVREFRYVLDNGPKTDVVTIVTRHNFARMLHDRGEALEAAEVLQTLVEHFKDHPDLAGQLGTNAQMTRARMHYFFACHYHELKDYAKEREHLDKALADDPDELDALIARYRLPDQSDEYRKETLEMIRASADALRENIANQPDEPVWYNQFAWLIGNTEGDFDEALRYSHKSLELSPDEGAYLDTLAHVYFAKKDYANAVKYQTRAVELESYSKLIRDKLEVFRAAWESP
ncbi:MAG: tetratricopeptide repeat protein [Thermoguttaceae bacterium]|jgi:tetratricopeptide (TPR) repeat protein|nr:tetratricopeptide repeat protein [Thermoguttaceae bacterium]